MSITNSKNIALITKILHNAQVGSFGFVKLKTPSTLKHFQHWLECGYHGNMNYLAESYQQRANPQKYFLANSAIVVAEPYSNIVTDDKSCFKALGIAKYARGQDYHIYLKEKLTDISQQLQEFYPQETFRVAVDSLPLLERDLAHNGGLGWFGKNCCLINEKFGSEFLIGEILTSLPLDSQVSPESSRCGECDLCIKACPAQAIISPGIIDTRKCIAYQTIESKDFIPQANWSFRGDWLFGCDECQKHCPWNTRTKVSKPTRDNCINKADLNKLQIAELQFILLSSNNLLKRKTGHSPLNRLTGNQLKRNALIICANLPVQELKLAITRYLQHPQLGQVAEWTLNKFN